MAWLHLMCVPFVLTYLMQPARLPGGSTAIAAWFSAMAGSKGLAATHWFALKLCCVEALS